MKTFEFHRPTTLTDAIALLQARDGAKFLAGGQSLLPVLKLDLAEISDLVSLTAVPELRSIRVEAGAVVIGALCTHDEVARSKDVTIPIPALAALAGAIGDPQVRNRGTLGGSVAHADPAADYPAAVLGLGATIVTDRRAIAADEYFTGLFETALARDEVITEVRFPIPRRASYVKFAHRASKYALVGVMVADTANGVRVAITGAANTVFRHAAFEDALTRDFSARALDGVPTSADDLNGDTEASAEYRAHLIGVMARRAVQALA